MDKKLTLSLDETTIELAKNYARAQNVSLSKLIEAYFKKLTAQKESPSEITPLVKSLSGVIELDSDFDEKSEYGDYLLEKYK